MPGGKHSDETRAIVLAALLAGSRIEDAAQAAGVDASTVRRWRVEPEFAAEIAAARKEIDDAVAARIEDERMRSVETIVSLRDDPDTVASVRLNAAFRLLELAVAQRVARDFAERLDVLWAEHEERTEDDDGRSLRAVR